MSNHLRKWKLERENAGNSQNQHLSATLLGETYKVVFLFVLLQRSAARFMICISIPTACRWKMGKDFPVSPLDSLSSVFSRQPDNTTVKMHGPDPLLLCCNPSKVKWIEFSLPSHFYWSAVFGAQWIGCPGISACDLLTYKPLWERCNWINHLTIWLLKWKTENEALILVRSP